MVNAHFVVFHSLARSLALTRSLPLPSLCRLCLSLPLADLFISFNRCTAKKYLLSLAAGSKLKRAAERAAKGSGGGGGGGTAIASSLALVSLPVACGAYRDAQISQSYKFHKTGPQMAPGQATSFDLQ